MGKDGIRDYAIRARADLIEQTALRLTELGISEGKTDRYGNTDNELKSQIIKDVEKRGFNRVVEDTACAWFNRLTCLRYMEVNGFVDSGIIDTGEIGRVYKSLFIRQCRRLANILPFVFKDEYGFQELLLPDRLFCEGGLAEDMVKSIDREAFLDNPQIIGWLYQHFISKKKSEVFAALKENRKIKGEDIPAATQLFTPDWIAKYMVENSVGRLWLDYHSDSKLLSEWRYFIDESAQDGKAYRQEYNGGNNGGNKRELSPERIKVLDPAAGSGHILVYAFDVLYNIYLSAGYERDRIPRLVLEKNLYGLDIDDRANALACFALVMKARSKDKDLFRRKVDLNLCSIHESNGLVYEDIVRLADYKRGDKRTEDCLRDINKLLNAFYDAKEYGSVIKLPDMDLKRLAKWWSGLGERMFTDSAQPQPTASVFYRVSNLIKQAFIMKGKYHVVLTNPPYMGIRGMNDRLAGYLNTHYRHSKHDLFTVFMELAENMTKPGGYLSLINQHSWMFLSSYRNFRERFLKSCCICSMLHLGSNAFENGIGTIVQTAAFAAKKNRDKNHRSVFVDLQGFGSSEAKRRALMDLTKGRCRGIKHSIRISELDGIPGKPVAYWADSEVVAAFKKGKKLDEMAQPRQGMATSDNNRFVRYWYEVPYGDIGRGFSSTAEAKRSIYRWFPYNKGGFYRKWYGNNRFVVNWQNGGEEIKELASSLYGSHTRTIKNIAFYFKEAITYTFISNKMGARYSPKGAIFDVAGSSIFLPGKELMFVLAFLCSKPAGMFLNILNPTFNIQVGDIKNLPVPEISETAIRDRIEFLVGQNIEISKADWNSSEVSMDFKTHPLIAHKRDFDTIEQAFNHWSKYARENFDQLKANEEELNRIFIEAFGLEQKLTHVLDDRDITVNRADRTRDIKSFISYAVGCMFGRYSPSREGIVHAGGAFIIPVTEGQIFEDNILSRFEAFVADVFGVDTLEQNLEYIAESLGRKHGETARDAIGRYFAKGFYKDHLKVYNRRPVYWLFDTGRHNAFKALVYMHRFDLSTLPVLKEKYIKTVKKAYTRRLNRMEAEANKGKCTARIKESAKEEKILKKRLTECRLYERALAEAIERKIEIDFEKGIMYNYARFRDICIPGLEGEAAKGVSLLAKIQEIVL